MSTVHFLNVNPGDCTIIEHNSNRVSVIDICSGHEDTNLKGLIEAAMRGNFRRGDFPTNPLDYLKRLGIYNLHRFINTHPEMDHLDGFDGLARAFSIANFWHTGVGREKPSFDGGPYHEEDWDQYALVREGRSGTASCVRLAGHNFTYANRNDDNSVGGDGLQILAPDATLVARAMESGDMNAASYVLVYRVGGQKIVFCGDAHDETFEYVLEKYERDLASCAVLIAPHHGRHSDRDYDFLDVAKPALTLFGNAPSEHLAYGPWNYRGLHKITSNQAGDIVLECTQGRIDVYVENAHCAQAAGSDLSKRHHLGNYYYGCVTPVAATNGVLESAV